MQSKTKVKLLLLLLLPLCTVLNRLFVQFPEQGESFYSTGINKWFIQVLSRISGVFPVSLFEILIYTAAIVLIGYTLFTLWQLITHFTQGFHVIGTYILNLGVTFSIVLFAFTTLWGLNYKRIHFDDKFGLVASRAYTNEDLANLYQYLLDEAASIRDDLPENADGVMVPLGNTQDIFERAHLGYDRVGQEFTTLQGSYGHAKPIFSSEALNYAGITGIYSPFTGEPNVNITVPSLTIPATTCHEMAHQRGYGFENECNFIAFITALAHPHLDFQYSALIMGISYTSNALAQVDMEALIRINDRMDPRIFRDLQSINDFWAQYEGEAKEVAEEVNNAYLQSNGVQDGTESYGEMVDLLLILYDIYR